MPGSRRLIKYKEGQPALELIRQPLYHRQQVAALGAQTIQYFNNIAGANLLISNMSTNGMLPSPQTFDIFGVTAVPAFGLNEADIVNFYNSSHLELRISSKPYFQLPMMKVPAGCGLAGVASTTVNNTTIFQTQNGLPSPVVWYPLDIDGISIHLPSNQDFNVQLQTFNAVAFTVAFNLHVYLEGILARPVL